MERSSFSYTQLGIGDCGHVVGTWPQVTSIGGGNPQVICDDCTRERWSLDETDVFTVWVGLKPPKKTPVSAPPKAKRVKAKKLSPWQTLLQEEGLF